MKEKDYDLLKTTIASIPDNKVETPKVPIHEFVKHAENLAEWSKHDEQVLIEVGLPKGFIKQISERVRFLQIAEILWQDEKTIKIEIEKSWKEKVEEAESLKTDLLCSYAYAFEISGLTSERLNAIVNKGSGTDIILHLQELLELGQSNLQVLQKIKFDFQKNNYAGQLVGELEIMLNYSGTQSIRYNKTKQMRNKAYTFLKQAVDNVRSFGKYAFWHSPERLEGYNLTEG